MPKRKSAANATPPKLTDLRCELREMASEEVAETSRWFFKTEPGQYGHGDKFLGIKVPEQRKAAKRYRDLPLSATEKLLQSKIHEERLTALLILVDKHKRGGKEERKDIYDLYLANLAHVNNWDLVDTSAHHIVGEHLQTRSRKLLDKLARSKVLWERRVAIIATLAFIKQNDFEDTLRISERLLHDKEDLIHKAVGWMLREVGNRDQAVEEAFLRPHYQQMPRTMLRYAIERFPEPLRQQYLHGEI